LLLVVPHIFAVPVSVLLVGLVAKEYITELGDVKDTQQHHWRCSKVYPPHTQVDTFLQVLFQVLIRTIDEPIGDWKKQQSQFGIGCC
jgi:hypothetical protein